MTPDETRLGTTADNGAGFSPGCESADLAGAASSDSAAPVFFPWLQGEGPYRLKLTGEQWAAIADGRQL